MRHGLIGPAAPEADDKIGQLPDASALTGTALLIGITAGSALGGALVAAAGVTAAFAVNAASFWSTSYRTRTSPHFRDPVSLFTHAVNKLT
jgi:predicted MFS family arabinose efflux permease